MRVAVVGGGMVGLACAHALLERDQEVVLFERAGIGAGASQGNTGWVVPSLSMPLASPGMLREGLASALDPRGALVIRPGLDTTWIRWLWQFRRCCSLERFRHGVAALVGLNRHTLEQLEAYERQGIAFESHAAGILVVAKDKAGLTWFTTLHGELARAGHSGVLEELSGEEARGVEPALGPAVDRALRTVVDRHVQPASLMHGLRDHLVMHGAEIRQDIEIKALTRSVRRWRLHVAPEGEELVDKVVIAAGAATRPLLEPLGVRLPLVGAKGYSVDLRGEGNPPRTALYLSEAKIGLSPFTDGVRIAGVFELPARDASVSPRRIRALIEDTAGYTAGWRPAAGEAAPGWAGLRPATPDGLPLLGEPAAAPGVVVATGHGMLGVTLAPATARVVAEIVATGQTPTWLAPFSPDRRI